MKDFTRHTLCPLAAAFIWGMAFSAQSVCADYLGTFTINAARSLIAALLLGAFCAATKRKPGNLRLLLVGGIACGASLFAASNLQQYGIAVSSAGKAGFITALYIVIIPLLGILLNKKVTATVWLAVAVAVVGMYFLCITEEFTIAEGDISLIICAFVFSVQILFIDHYSLLIDNVVLAASQFLVMGILSTISALLVGETASPADFAACLWPLMYIAIFSSCIAYTLQIIGQRGGNPTIVALIMSLEAVFAMLGGVILLGETMNRREWLGCGLMAAAIVLAQLPERKKKKAA